MSKELANLLADLDEDGVLSAVKERLGNGDDPLKLVKECRAGMAVVGEQYERGEYFLSDLVMSAIGPLFCHT